jgi:hypothetical protein
MNEHWLARTETIRRLWIAFIVILAVVVLADLFVERKSHFGVDATLGFGAWFGFASCIVLIVFAKGLGIFLKRRDDYYDR